MQEFRVTERSQGFDMIRWDGTAEAAGWITEHFGEQAQFEGEGDELTFKMYGTWEIPVGDYVVDKWQTFQYAPASQVDDLFQPAAPSVTQ